MFFGLKTQIHTILSDTLPCTMLDQWEIPGTDFRQAGFQFDTKFRMPK